MRARTVRVDRWEKTPTRTAQDKIKIKNPGRQQHCWGSLFCTNLTQPTGALDSKASDELLSLFSEINRTGQTIVMVTHSVKAASTAGRVLFIRDGEVFHQIYRGNDTDEQLYQKISDTLTLLATGGDRR